MDINATVDLTGRVAVVTGGGRGLGLAYATALAGAGAAVVVNDADPDAAASAVDAIAASGGTASAAPGAVGPTDVAERLIDHAVKAYGRLDILVTNAGVLRDRMVWKMTDDDFDTVIDVHLRGTFTCVRAAVRRLREQGDGGRIVVVGSPAGQRGNIGQTNYSAAKAGMAGFSKALAQEVVRKGVTVNTISPGYVETDMVMAIRKEVRDQIVAAIPMGRLAKPQEIAAVVAFLASEEAGYITGANISVNGGMHMM
jgi:NAD(P)-dependent dehydrogenase (short-subunit alcohol dehydrogenase family)